MAEVSGTNATWPNQWETDSTRLKKNVKTFEREIRAKNRKRLKKPANIGKKKATKRLIVKKSTIFTTKMPTNSAEQPRLFTSIIKKIFLLKNPRISYFLLRGID